MDNSILNETESSVPVNVMGSSSSTAGTGGIDTFDPLLKKNKMISRTPKKLRNILSKKSK